MMLDEILLEEEQRALRIPRKSLGEINSNIFYE